MQGFAPAPYPMIQIELLYVCYEKPLRLKIAPLKTKQTLLGYKPRRLNTSITLECSTVFSEDDPDRLKNEIEVVH
jgi:hypothetical protein